MKKYKSLKDLPGIKAGTILGIQDILPLYEIDKGLNNIQDNNTEKYILENYNEWFEEVKDIDRVEEIINSKIIDVRSSMFPNGVVISGCDLKDMKSEIYQWAIDMLNQLYFDGNYTKKDLPIINKILEKVDNSVDKIFNRFDAIDQNILQFYKDYGKKLNS